MNLFLLGAAGAVAILRRCGNDVAAAVGPRSGIDAAAIGGVAATRSEWLRGLEDDKKLAGVDPVTVRPGTRQLGLDLLSDVGARSAG